MLAGLLTLKRGIGDLIQIMAYFLCERARFSYYPHFFKISGQKNSFNNETYKWLRI